MSNALIVESPENIILPTGKKLTYEDSDAYAFIYLGGEL